MIRAIVALTIMLSTVAVAQARDISTLRQDSAEAWQTVTEKVGSYAETFMNGFRSNPTQPPASLADVCERDEWSILADYTGSLSWSDGRSSLSNAQNTAHWACRESNRQVMLKELDKLHLKAAHASPRRYDIINAAERIRQAYDLAHPTRSKAE